MFSITFLIKLTRTNDASNDEFTTSSSWLSVNLPLQMLDNRCILPESDENVKEKLAIVLYSRKIPEITSLCSSDIVGSYQNMKLSAEFDFNIHEMLDYDININFSVANLKNLP